MKLEMDKERNNLKEIFQRLQKDDQIEIKKWNESLVSKIILLFPLVIFLITFLSINNDKSFIDLIAFISFGGGLVLIGIIINFLLSDK